LPPAQWHPQELPRFTLHAGAGSLWWPPEEAKTEKLFDNFVEPQCGHLVPFQRLDRTNNSLSFRHLPQWNS
jgi:hypothetical protein